MKALEEMGKFATVVIDPPWDIDRWDGPPVDCQHEHGHYREPYQTMTLADIAGLPDAAGWPIKIARCSLGLRRRFCLIPSRLLNSGDSATATP